MDKDKGHISDFLGQRKEKLFGKSGSLGQLIELEITLVEPGPWQPRQTFDEEALEELANSIKSKGQLEAGLVVHDPEKNRYLLIAGERRWRAAQMAGKETYKAEVLPKTVKDYSDQDLKERALISNVQRADLDPFEEAESLKALMEEHSHTLESLGEVIGKKKSTVEDLLRLNDLPQAVRDDFRTSGNRISKSVLIEVAREKDERKRMGLWAAVVPSGRRGRTGAAAEAHAKDLAPH